MRSRHRLTWAAPMILGVTILAPAASAEDPPPPVGPPSQTLPPPPTIHGDVYRLSMQIQGEFEQTRLGLTRLGVAPLLAELQVVAVESEKLAGLAAQRTDIPTIHAQFDTYKLLWTHLATRLRAMPGANPWLIGHVDAVEHQNDLLDELLLLGPSGVYDRAKVAPLTSKLADSTSLLVRVVKVYATKVPGAQELVLSAQRVQQHADQLTLAVQQNLAFTAILEQFGQFSEAWQVLLPLLQGPPPLPPQALQLSEEITRLRAALNEGLLVKPPTATIHQRHVALATSLAQHGNALVATLLKELLATAGPVHAAEDFTESAQSLCLWLKAHPMPKVDLTRPEVVAVTESWRRLQNQLNRLDRADFPVAFQLAEQIRGELETLYATMRR